MSARDHGAVITYERDNFNKFQRYTSSVDTHKWCNCKVRSFFEMEKNAGKIMITIDKPLERNVTGLGVSLRPVDGVYQESQATWVHIYHTVNTYVSPGTIQYSPTHK